MILMKRWLCDYTGCSNRTHYCWQPNGELNKHYKLFDDMVTAWNQAIEEDEATVEHPPQSLKIKLYTIYEAQSDNRGRNNEDSVVDVIDSCRRRFLLTHKSSLSSKKDSSSCLAFQVNCMVTATFLRFPRIHEVATSLIASHSSSSSIFDIESAAVPAHLIVANELCRTVLYPFALTFCSTFLMTMALNS